MNRRVYDKPLKFNLTLILLSIIAICLLAVWLRIGWVLFYPYNPLVVHGPYKILNEGKRVMAGEPVLMEAVFTKNTGLPAITSRQFVNKFIYYVAPKVTNLPTQMKKTTTIPVDTPPNAAPGKYKIYNTYTYRISNFPKRDITVSAWTEEFEIIARPEKKIGTKGVKGDRGVKGDPGPRGGISLFGKGDPGKQGPVGKQGPKGDPGGKK